MVYLASDPGGESEALAWHLKVALGLEESEYQRITFASITPGMMKALLHKSRKNDYHLLSPKKGGLRFQVQQPVNRIQVIGR